MLARFYLLTCVIFWGWTFVATKIVLDYLTPVELLGLRLLCALPVLFLIIKAKGVRLEFSPKARKQLLIGSGIITAHFLIQITGLKYTSATNTGWIISISPLFMALLSYLILKERLGRREIIGIVIATIGVLLLMSRGDLTSLAWMNSIGDWLVLISAHTWALYTVATRDLSREGNPLGVTFMVLLPAGIIILLYMTFQSDWAAFLAMSTEAWIALLFLGVVGLALAHWFWQEGVAEIGAARAGVYLYLEPIATTALAVPYLGESFTWATGVGGALVIAGVFWAQRKVKKLPA